MITSQARSIALIDNYYAALNAGNHEELLGYLADQIAHDINQGEREIGKAAFRRALARADRSYLEYLSDIVIMANADGTRVAAEFIINGEYLVCDGHGPQAHGQRYEIAAGTYFSICDNLINRITVYYNLADWIIQVSD